MVDLLQPISFSRRQIFDSNLSNYAVLQTLDRAIPAAQIRGVDEETRVQLSSRTTISPSVLRESCYGCTYNNLALPVPVYRSILQLSSRTDQIAFEHF